MPMQGLIFFAEAGVSFSQYLHLSEVYIQENQVIRTQQDSIFSPQISIWQQQSTKKKMQICFFL